MAKKSEVKTEPKKTPKTTKKVADKPNPTKESTVKEKVEATKQTDVVQTAAKDSKKKPQDHEPVTFKRFRSGYQVLSMLIGLLAVLVVFNLGLLFFLAWAVGQQLDKENEGSHGERLVNIEEKVEATIEALPAQFRPKIDLDVVRPDAQEDRWKGDKDNRYVWIKYSDLECPYCSTIQPEVNQFLENNPDEVAVVFRHYPITTRHPNALRLAETAECVAEYNGESAFWDFIERTYTAEIPPEVSGQEELSEFVENPSQVASCVEEGDFRDKIERDFQDANKATVEGTPTFIIYDMQTDETKYVTNPGSSEGMQKVQDEFEEKQEG